MSFGLIIEADGLRNAEFSGFGENHFWVQAKFL